MWYLIASSSCYLALALIGHYNPSEAFTPVVPSSLSPSRRRFSSLQVSNSANDADEEYDVVVVGSGIGGLCTAAMSTLYGYKTAVFESHYAPGGCAHGFRARAKGIDGDFCFDTGPSFFSGLNPDIPAKTSNPLRTVLDAIGERVECEKYETFG